MAGLRGPDSSKDAQLLDERAVFPETVDVNIRQLDPIPAPRYFLKELPLTNEMSDLVLKSRQEIRDVLNGKDDRLLAIVGPCSIHDPKAAHEYAAKLAAVKKELEDQLVIVMRVYFEKPRTTIGWKGLINDPDLDGQFNIRKGMWLARKVLADVLSLGLPAATEWLDPITPQYICDLISWGAIGARTTESQVHRELASGLSCPVGFKNGTDGNLKIAVDAIRSASQPHHFLSVTKSGLSAIVSTAGNPDCHVILRGGKEPNYSADHVRAAAAELAAVGLSQKVMVDFSHANSRKDYKRQMEVTVDVANQLAAGDTHIFGVMVESHLVEGRQDLKLGCELTYGQSITDACIGWDDTEQLLKTLAEAVTARRAKLGTPTDD